MLDIDQLLFTICEDERVFEPGIDLIESGLLDSFAMIELFSILEDNGIDLQPTRINRDLLRTVDGIQTLIREATQNREELVQ